MVTKTFSKATKQMVALISLFVVCCSIIPMQNQAESLPDLWLYSIQTVDSVVEGEKISITVRIQNSGTKNVSAGTIITDALLIDGVVVVTNSFSAGLGVEKLRYLNLSWTATLGSHTQRTMKVIVDHQDTIDELDENNNVYEQIIEVTERGTDLAFGSDIYIGGVPRVGASVPVFVKVTNLGKNTTKSVNVSFYVDDSLKQYQSVLGLERSSLVNLTFSWMPLRFGSHNLKIRLDPQDVIDEYSESNNQKTKTVTADASRLVWWDASWHYRRFYDIGGSGIISVSMDFTQLLNDLKISDSTFDNRSIRVVKYNSNGTIHSLVTNYSFNESTSYNCSSNAKGNLTWQVTGPSYYYVYFDVLENTAVRTELLELGLMQTSGNPTVRFHGSAEGWWFDSIDALRTYYVPNKKMYMNMSSSAYALNATGRLFKEGVYDHYKSLLTTDHIVWRADDTFSASKRGNWTLEIQGFDEAGYGTERTNFSFFVGYPDLILDRISFSSDFPQDSPIYEGNSVLITSTITVRNASVNDVNISVYINGVYNHTSSKVKVNLSKGANTVGLTWFAKTKGTYTLEVRIDPANKIPESNNNNNNKAATLKIEGTPDLYVASIYYPTTTFEEGEPVPISTVIKNVGHGRAFNYTVNLYLEQRTENKMYYTSAKKSALVSLDMDDSVNVTITWPAAVYGTNGKWIVGIKILYSSLKPDSNTTNNSLARFDVRLKVNKTENLEPVISLTTIGVHERREPVTITARITDASGISNVTIKIKNPENTWQNKTMKLRGSDEYSYVFTETAILGSYSVYILAIDASASLKKSWKDSSFEIIEDETSPIFEYSGVYPSVQHPGKPVEISCITVDLNGISSVWVRIRSPDDTSENITMDQQDDSDDYVFSESFTKIGRYVFLITAEDMAGNEEQTDEQEFWITNDFNDTDSDGMPDAWETLYGFNPRDSDDANMDKDDDGYSNLEEYQQGLNPSEKNSAFGEIGQHLSDNIGYLAVSCILFGVLVALVLFGLRRMKQ